MYANNFGISLLCHPYEYDGCSPPLYSTYNHEVAMGLCQFVAAQVEVEQITWEL